LGLTPVVGGAVGVILIGIVGTSDIAALAVLVESARLVAITVTVLAEAIANGAP
jgi:hypothetical protein